MMSKKTGLNYFLNDVKLVDNTSRVGYFTPVL